MIRNSLILDRKKKEHSKKKYALFDDLVLCGYYRSVKDIINGKKVKLTYTNAIRRLDTKGYIKEGTMYIIKVNDLDSIFSFMAEQMVRLAKDHPDKDKAIITMDEALSKVNNFDPLN